MDSLFIEGSWVKGRGPTLHSFNPATSALLWTGNEASTEDVDLAFAAAQKAFKSWSSLMLEERIVFLNTLKSILEKNKSSLAVAISEDTGKPLWESLQEVSSMCNKIPLSIEAYHDRCKERAQESAKGTLRTLHRPHGVIGILGPFNFPGHLPHGHIVPALLAGNTVVFKGSEKTPHVSCEIFKCWQQAHLPPGVLNLVQGKAEIGSYLASHKILDGLFFTGSHAVGMQLQRLVNPGKILALEMGGNNPLVIDDIEDVEAAAYLTLQSAFLTTGQRCTCARRLIVIGQNGFIEALIALMQTLIVGPYTQLPEPFMGPLIDMHAKASVLDSQKQLLAAGAHALVPMHSLEEAFVSPALVDVTAVKERQDTEIFGPLLQLIRVSTFEEALIEARSTGYGLSAGYVGKSEARFKRFLQAIKAGVVNWNSPLTAASSNAPFGGVGKSGNYHPSAYYAADYAAYPTASMQTVHLTLPQESIPGILKKGSHDG